MIKKSNIYKKGMFMYNMKKEGLVSCVVCNFFNPFSKSKVLNMYDFQHDCLNSKVKT